jgi:hypothetical protein
MADPRVLKLRKAGVILKADEAPPTNPQQQTVSEPPVPVKKPVAEADDFSFIIRDLKNTSRIWPRIADVRTKELAAAYFISEFKDKGIGMVKQPLHYVRLVDDLLAQNPDSLSWPFAQLLQFVAIVEYDFNNGQNKDDMARRLLGEEGCLRNKKRLGIP